MGADSAVTITRAGESTVLTDAQKLRPIDHLRAGISFWSLAQIAKRNGNWYFYVQWLNVMEQLLESNFRARGIQIPVAGLAGREEFVRFRIKTIADLYKMSDSLKFISEPIATLEISPIPVYSRYSVR